MNGIISSLKYDLIHRYNSMSQIEKDEIDIQTYNNVMTILISHQEQTQGCNQRLIERLKKVLEEI